MSWILFFLGALILSGAINYGLIFLIKKNKKLNFIKENKLIRLGGIGIIVSFCLVVLLNSKLVITSQVEGLLWGGIAILFFGFWDDFKNISWKTQLIFQGGLVGLLIFFGYSIVYFSGWHGEMISLNMGGFFLLGKNFSIIGLLVIFFWLISIVNAVGWTDGVDGLLGTIAILGALALFFVSLRSEVNQPAVAIISLIFLGSVLGFWFFNFPPARIEAGTTGSYFVGFFLATMSIMAGTKMATIIIVLAIPLVDFIWVIAERIKERQAITKKDQRHLHYKLRRLGWSDKRMVITWISFVTIALMIVLSLSVRRHKLEALIIELILILIFVVWVGKKDK